VIAVAVIGILIAIVCEALALYATRYWKHH